MYAKHGLAPAISSFVHRDPVPVYNKEEEVGRATSVTWGTTIKKMVGFGSVDKGHAAGTRLSVERSVEGERGKVAATVVPLPFLDLDRKRTWPLLPSQRERHTRLLLPRHASGNMESPMDRRSDTRALIVFATARPSSGSSSASPDRGCSASSSA